MFVWTVMLLQRCPWLHFCAPTQPYQLWMIPKIEYWEYNINIFHIVKFMLHKTAFTRQLRQTTHKCVYLQSRESRRSHHSVCHSRKPPCCMETSWLYLTQDWSYCPLKFYIAHVTLIRLSFTNVRCPRKPEMNFLCRGFQKLSYYIHKYVHTWQMPPKLLPHHFVGDKSSLADLTCGNLHKNWPSSTCGLTDRGHLCTMLLYFV